MKRTLPYRVHYFMVPVVSAVGRFHCIHKSFKFIFQGTASQKKQLKFWGLFVDMMIVSDRQNGNVLTKEER